MRPGDEDRVAALVAGAFGGDAPGEMEAQLKLAWGACPWTPLEGTLVAEEDGRVVACGQALQLEVRFGRVAVPAVGIHAVVAEPGLADPGLPRAMWERGRDDALARGTALMIGFARKRGVFSRGGAVPLMVESTWRLDAWRLPEPRQREFRELEPGDEERVAEWHALDGQARPLSLVRPAGLRPWLPRRAPLVRVHPRGYLGLRDNRDGSLEVREVGGADPAFHREALLEAGALARAAGARELRGHVPPDHPFVLASLPFGPEVAVAWRSPDAGPMGFLLAVEPFLRRLEPELAARLEAAGGSGLDLVVRAGEEEVRLGLGQGRRSDRLELELGPGPLLQVIAGYRAAEEALAERLERGEDRGGLARRLLEEPEALGRLRALFPRGYPFMWPTDRF